MKWSILEVSKKKTIRFEEELDLTQELKQRSEEILDAKPVKVQGQICQSPLMKLSQLKNFLKRMKIYWIVT